MADYLVLEEDGTSHLELEESTSDLTLEESGPWANHTVNVDDYVGDGVDPFRTIADSVNVVNRTDVNYTVNPADGVAVSDSVGKVQAHVRAPADAVTVSDSAVPKYVWTNYTVTPADSVAVSDVQNVFENTTADAYQDEDAAAAPFELEEGTGFIELEETGGWTNHTLTVNDNVALTDYQFVILNGRRVSQVPVEVVVTPTSGAARASQVPVEIVYRVEDQKARISQVPVEVVTQTIPGARFSQEPVEVVQAPLDNERQRYWDEQWQDNPDGIWRLDDPSGDLDDSSGTGTNEHPFVPSGSVSYGQPGPAPSIPSVCVGAGGGASQPSFSTVMDNVTFEAWFMPSSVTADHQVIFSNVNGSAGWALLINTNGKLQVVVNGSTYLAESQQALTTGQWYYITVMRRSGVWRYYINGQVDTPSAGTATPGSAVTTMHLLGSAALTGCMSGAAYYERALSGGEVLRHYEAVFPDETVPGRARWKVGVIDVPAGAGSVSVNLGKRPNAVFFYGANWTAEDTIVTTDHTALFRGMVAPNYDFPSTLVQCAVAHGPNHTSNQDLYAILNIKLDATADVLYRATVSFSDTGFTANFDTGAAGGYKVIYVALTDVRHCLGRVGDYASVVEFGFKPEASLIHGSWNPFNDDVQTDWHASSMAFYGGGGYPGTNDLTWEGHGAGMTNYYFQAGVSQHMTEMYNSNPRTIITSAAHHLVGMVPENAHVEPTGDGFLEWQMSSFHETKGMSIGWDDDKTDAGFGAIPAAVDDESFHNTDGTRFNADLFDPGLVLFYSISNEPDELGLPDRGAIGFGVATPDFQWCALVDHTWTMATHPETSAYQSFSKGFIDCVTPAGVHAGEVTLEDEGFTLKTTIASTTPGSLLWHAFGYPVSAVWIPHMSRTDR